MKWRKLVVMTKILISDKFDKICYIFTFWQTKNGIFGDKIFQSLFIISIQLRLLKKWWNLGFVAKFLTKFALFDKRKDKWKPKALKLFWQDFIELANNSYSYALLKSLISEWWNLAKIQVFWPNFWQNLHFFEERKMAFLVEKSFGVYCSTVNRNNSQQNQLSTELAQLSFTKPHNFYRLVESSASGLESFGCRTHFPLSISTLMSSSKSTLGSCCALLTLPPAEGPLPNTLGLNVFSDCGLSTELTAMWVLHITPLPILAICAKRSWHGSFQLF